MEVMQTLCPDWKKKSQDSKSKPSGASMFAVIIAVGAEKAGMSFVVSGRGARRWHRSWPTKLPQHFLALLRTRDINDMPAKNAFFARRLISAWIKDPNL
jgi:hypothetical protein